MRSRRAGLARERVSAGAGIGRDIALLGVDERPDQGEPTRVLAAGRHAGKSGRVDQVHERRLGHVVGVVPERHGPAAEAPRQGEQRAPPLPAAAKAGVGARRTHLVGHGDLLDAERDAAFGAPPRQPGLGHGPAAADVAAHQPRTERGRVRVLPLPPVQEVEERQAVLAARHGHQDPVPVAQQPVPAHGLVHTPEQIVRQAVGAGRILRRRLHGHGARMIRADAARRNRRPRRRPAPPHGTRRVTRRIGRLFDATPRLC